MIANGAASVTLTANGPFTLVPGLATGATYQVAARTNELEKRCTVRGGKGQVGVADVTGLVVDCSVGLGWVTDGEVLATALSADERTLFIGGSFSRVGPPSGSFVQTDASTGRVLHPSQPVVADVMASAGDGQGGAYLTLKNRQRRSFESASAAFSVARISADGQMAPSFNLPSMGGVPSVFLRVGGRLFVGGSFTLGGSLPNHGLAELDAATGALQSWRTSVGPGVAALAASGNTLFAVRKLLTPSGEKTTLAAIDLTSGAVRSWAPVFEGSFGNSPDLQIAVSSSSLIVAGPFTAVDSVPRASIASFDLNTLALQPWDPAPTYAAGFGVAGVAAVEAAGDVVYLSGGFDQIGGANRNGLAALSASSGQVLSWQAQALPVGGFVSQMTIHDGSLVLAGTFTTIGGLPRSGLAALSTSTGALLDYGAAEHVPYPLKTISSGQRLWAAGNFLLAGGVKRDRIAAIDTQTGRATDWQLRLGPDSQGVADREVRHLLTIGNRLVMAGSFDSIAGVSRRNIGAVDLPTGAVLAWDAQFGPASQVRRLLLQGPFLYVVGGFADWAGQPRRGVARFGASTLDLDAWSILAPQGFDPETLAATSDLVYVAGGDSGALAFDASTGSRAAWTSGALGFGGSPPLFKDLVVSGAAVFAVGSNIVVPGVNSIVNSVRLGSLSGAATPWPANSSNLSRLFLADGQLLATRCSITTQEVKSCMLAVLDPGTGAQSALVASPNDEVNALSSDATSYYVGGKFGSNGVSRQSLMFLSR